MYTMSQFAKWAGFEPIIYPEEHKRNTRERILQQYDILIHPDDERPRSCVKCGAVMWVDSGRPGLTIDGGEKDCFHQWQIGDIG